MRTSELENWLMKNCNGDWEHQGGITIESTDNPGWHIKVDFDKLDFPSAGKLEKYGFTRTDSDYVTIARDIESRTISIACGVMNLSDALGILTREKDS